MSSSRANDEEIAYWNGPSGERWVRAQERTDAMIGPMATAALADPAVRPGARVIDIGCGCGGSSLELARRVGPDGSVLGVDVSGSMLERARERAREAGLGQLRFVEADAQTHPLPSADVVHSRFGVMFFDDPAVAFANMRRALAPDGRLLAVVWQPPDRNAWLSEPAAVVSGILEMPEAGEEGRPNPFALADPETTRSILTEAGFERIELEPIEGAVRLGTSVEDAVDFVLKGVGAVAKVADAAPEDARAAAGAALGEHFAKWSGESGVEAGAAVVLIRADP